MPATTKALATNKTGWSLLAPEAALTAFSGAKGAFNATSSVPTGNGKFDIDPGETQGLAVKFVGFPGTSGATNEFDARIWLFEVPDGEVPEQYSATYIGTVRFKLGAGTFDFMGQTDIAFAESIVVTEDASLAPPGFKVYGDFEDAAAEIHFDTVGADKVYIEIVEGHANNGNVGILSRPL